LLKIGLASVDIIHFSIYVIIQKCMCAIHSVCYTKAVAGAVPFQKVHFCTQRLHIGTLVVHIST